MKSIFIPLFVVISVIASSFTSSDINFNPGSLSKEIKKHFNVADFQKKEIASSNFQAKNRRIQGKFFSLSLNGQSFGYAYVGRVNACRNGGCTTGYSKNQEIDDGNSEFFDYFTLFNLQKEVVSVVVYNYEATHGQEITVKGWLKQFIGYRQGKKLNIGENVDAISGATISTHSIVEDLKDKTRAIAGFYN